MTTTKKRNQYFQNLRHLHRLLAPIMLLPLLLTLITGTIYQIFDLAGKGDQFDWLLGLHKGNFGILNLESIYPFLSALGLLVLLFTGISLWLNMRRPAKKHS
jgi:hypothetical protein